MKHIITIIALALVSLTLSAKEVAKTSNGLTLFENAGVYSIKGSTGVILLGNKEQTKTFLTEASKLFIKDTLNDIFDCGKNQYKVMKDDEGRYLIKVGLGAVKVREGDIFELGAALGLKNMKKAGEKFYSKVQDGVGKLIDKM